MDKSSKELFKCTPKEDEHKKAQYRKGRWDLNEHKRFLKACYHYRDDWDKIEETIMTRSLPQIRSHAQKYLIKLSKKYRVKLYQKKFSKPTAKHLIHTYTEGYKIDDIANMNKYDKNIFDMFKYYNRDFNIKGDDSINNEDCDTADHSNKDKGSIEIRKSQSDVDVNVNKDIMNNNVNMDESQCEDGNVDANVNVLNPFYSMSTAPCELNYYNECLINYLWELNYINFQSLLKLESQNF